MTEPRANPAAMPPKKIHHPRPFRRRDKPIPTAPADQEHSERAARVEAVLAALGVRPVKVYPTVNREGFAQFTFDELDKLTGSDTSHD